MAIQTAITAVEVRDNSPADRNYPLDNICLAIETVEQDFGYECLGDTLYNWILTNANVYPDETLEWECNKYYKANEFVVRSGRLYESLANDTRSDPLIETTEWRLWTKFTANACANEMWDYVVKALSPKVFARSLGYTTRKAGTGGLTLLAGGESNFGNQGVRSANKAEISDYKTDLLADEEAALRNFRRWVAKKTTSADTCNVPLSTIPNCGILCGVNTGQKRRWGFKN